VACEQTFECELHIRQKVSGVQLVHVLVLNIGIVLFGFLPCSVIQILTKFMR
jgi:hypothetical protein